MFLPYEIRYNNNMYVYTYIPKLCELYLLKNFVTIFIVHTFIKYIL